jgi:anaphase-promoting complex subunit 3
MGLVYAKRGKIRQADHHYRRAAEINPTNAVLLSSIGSVSHSCFQRAAADHELMKQVLEQSDDIVSALKFYELACKNAPESPMIQFKRIRCLVAMQRIEVCFSPRGRHT